MTDLVRITCPGCGRSWWTSPHCAAAGGTVCEECDRTLAPGEGLNPAAAAQDAPLGHDPALPGPGTPPPAGAEPQDADVDLAPLEGRLISERAGRVYPEELIGIVAETLARSTLGDEAYRQKALRILGALDDSGLLVDVRVTNEWGAKVWRNIRERKAAQETAVRLRQDLEQATAANLSLTSRLAVAEHQLALAESIVRDQVAEIERLRLLARTQREQINELIRLGDIDAADAARVIGPTT